MRILIAEHEDILALVLEDKLKKNGHNILIINNAEFIKNKIEEFSPDVIILDLSLPSKNGFDVLLDLKSDQVFKKIPVITILENENNKDVERALSIGAKDYIVKNNQDILIMINKINIILESLI